MDSIFGLCAGRCGGETRNAVDTKDGLMGQKDDYFSVPEAKAAAKVLTAENEAVKAKKAADRAAQKAAAAKVEAQAAQAEKEATERFAPPPAQPLPTDAEIAQQQLGHRDFLREQLDMAADPVAEEAAIAVVHEWLRTREQGDILGSSRVSTANIVIKTPVGETIGLESGTYMSPPTWTPRAALVP
jgi:hypothetical protein